MSATRLISEQKLRNQQINQQRLITRQITKTQQRLNLRNLFKQQFRTKQLAKYQKITQTTKPIKTTDRIYTPVKTPIIKKTPLFNFKIDKGKNGFNEKKLLKSSDVKVYAQGFTEKALGLKKLRIT